MFDCNCSVCPLAAPYQLVRNVLGAVVRDGTVDMGRGHALLVYDFRSPVFRPHRGGAFEEFRAHLREPALLRRCSWQSIVTAMADYREVGWLVEQLRLKYGLVPA